MEGRFNRALESDALVVDTTNFTDQTSWRGSSSMLHVVERFSLSDANTLSYPFTIDDPASFLHPESVEDGNIKDWGGCL